MSKPPCMYPARATRRVAFAFALLACTIAVPAALAQAQTRAEDFEDGSISPFNVEVAGGNEATVVTPSGFSARAGTKVHRLKWYQANYDGSRARRGVEGSSGGNATNPRIRDEGWYAFSFYPKSGEFPSNKAMIVAQIICWHSSLPNTDKTITVSRNAANALTISGYSGTGGAATLTASGTLLSSVTYDTWHDVIIYVKFSNNGTGILKVWVDGAPESSPTFAATNINIGNGAFDSPNLMTHGGYVKWGMYCWDAANYTAGETRTFYFDEIAYYPSNSSGAFDIVKPEGYGGGSGTVPAAPSGLSAVTASSSQIDLAWTDNATNETSYRVERKTGLNGTYAQVASLGAGAVSHSSTGLAAGTAYYFRVAAANSAGDSGYSNEVSATTQSGSSVVYAENFDAMASGSAPSGWSVSNGSNTATTVRSTPSASDKSMRSWDDNTAALTQATDTFSAQSGAVTIQWLFNQNGVGNAHRMFVRSGGTSAIELYTIGGNLVYRNAAGTDLTVAAIPAGSWYDVKVVANTDTDTADVYFNNSATAALVGVSFRNAVASIDGLLFGTSNASSGVHLFIDDITVTR